MKSTKKSLFLSTLSLVLCFAMLLGTTYAWFTDSVTSGVNQIIAGNLDVELYHSATTTVTATEENKVKSDTMLFNNIEKWEPGVVAYENFLVKNVGSLALKYQLAMIVGEYNVTHDGNHSLNEVLKVAVVPGGFTGGRAEAQALTGYTTLKDFSTRSNGALLPNTGDTFGIVIYWQPNVQDDNLYNLNNGKTATTTEKFTDEKVLGIELGIKLEATQLPSEYDSFDNQYDAPADGTDTWKGSASAVAENGKTTTFTVDVAPATEQKTVIEFEDGALADGSYKLDVKTENNLFTATSENGEAATIDLKLYDKEGKLTESFTAGKTATITTYVSKGMSGVGVSYTGNDGKDQPTFVSYDAETGKLVFKTNHFSEYEVKAASVAYIKETDTAYDTLASGIEKAAAGQTVVVLKDIAVTAPVDVAKKITLNLNGKTISEGSGYAPQAIGLLAVKRGGDLTLTGNGKVVGTTAIAAINMTRGNSGGYTTPDPDTGDLAKLTVQNGEIIGLYYGIAGNGSRQNTEVVINGGTIKGTAENDNAGIYNPQKGTLTINGGTIEGAVGIYVKAGDVTTTVDGGTIKGIGVKADFSHNGSGINNTGDAFVVENCGYPGGVPNVSIQGGTFISTNNNAVASYAYGEGNTPVAGFITGGTFSSDVSAYCATGSYSNKEGNKWVVSDHQVIPVAPTQGQTVTDAVVEALEEAQNGDIILLPESSPEEPIVLPSEVNAKEVTLKGAGVDKTQISHNTAEGHAGAKLSITDATLVGGTSNYVGFQHTDTEYYENCKFTGLSFFYAGKVVCKNCTFEQSTYEYCFWTYGSKDITFDGCTFNTVGKAAKVYNESYEETFNVTFKDCTFNTSNKEKNKPAIAVNSLGATFNVTITNCTAPDFANGNSCEDDAMTDWYTNRMASAPAAARQLVGCEGNLDKINVSIDGTTY